jgi:hypothetical protein
MSEKYQGGCQCGALRYEVTGELGKLSLCHCRMCQKAVGSFAASFVPMPVQNFRWTRGAPSEFRSSAIVARGFCNQCGTPMYLLEDGELNIEIAAGTFDHAEMLGPLDHESGVESRVPWFGDLGHVPTQKTTDYRTPGDMVKLESLQHPDHDTDVWPRLPK